MPRGIPKKLNAFDAKLKDEIITSAAKIASKTSTHKQECENIVLSSRQEESRLRIQNAMKYGMEMTEQEFLNAVSKKLQHMVTDSLNDLHDSIDKIPPQNKAYAVGMLFDKFMTISGRPTNITANASVKLGASDMSPDKVRSILKGNAKNAETIVVDEKEG